MSVEPSSWTYMVELNGRAAQAMTVATSFPKSAAAAVPAIFGVQDEYPLHIVIWVKDHERDYDGPWDYLIEEPGVSVCTFVWDEETGAPRSLVGLGPHFAGLAQRG